MSCRLSKKGIFLQGDLWDSTSHSWKEWHSLAQEFGLLAFDCLSLMELQGLTPKAELYKLNIGMPGPFWRDWSWCFGQLLQHYDSRHLYFVLHQRHLLSSILNANWTYKDSKDRWIHRLHSIWSYRLSYKLRVFAWLVIYQGVSSKAKLSKSRLSDGLYLVCQ